MELVQQDQLPARIQPLLNARPAVHPGNRADYFYITVKYLRLSIEALQIAFGSIGTAVGFQIQLIIPHRQLIALPLKPLKKLFNKLYFSVRQAGKLFRPQAGLHHLSCRSASAIGIPVYIQVFTHGVLLGKIIPVPPKGIRVILLPEMGRRKMGDYLTAVGASPSKAVMRKIVGIVPDIQLYSAKILHSGFFQNLR